MLTPKQQQQLTQTSANTPMGKLLRCYWYPVAISSDLKLGNTKKIRILSEDLILFRDTLGNLGIVEEKCPHRRISLAHSCIDHEGIRCPYHGWKFDHLGNCLEIPTENNNPKLLETIKIKAYLVQELGGLIFVYLGEKPAPLLPNYDLFVWDHVIKDIGYAIIPCNWVQIMENSVDPYHLEWLHGHHLRYIRGKNNQSTPTFYPKKQVKIAFDLFEYGIIKRRMIEGGSEQDDDWKIGHPLIFPNYLRVGTFQQHRFQIRVPIDDFNTLHFWYSCYIPRDNIKVPLQKEIPSYEVIWQDEKGDFILDFVDGQDIMCWVTQGKIADRSQEILVTADKGILLYRKLLLGEMAKVESGNEPMGVIREEEKNKIIEFPQEKNKFGHGQSFLKEAIEMSHVKYSPIKDLIKQYIL